MTERIFSYRNYWLGQRERSTNWYIFWRQPGSRRVHRRTTGTDDLEVAKEVLVTFVKGAPSARVNESNWLPLTVLFDKYLDSLRGQPSYRNTRYIADGIIKFCERNSLRYVSQFTPEDQEHYVRFRRRQIRDAGHLASNGTINRELGILRAAFNYAARCGHAVDVPDVRLKPEPPPREKIISATEARLLLNECHTPHLRLFVLMALYTLQRPAAILNLRWAQVDLAENRIDFNPLGRPQTAKRRPVVPIAAPLWKVLAESLYTNVSGYVIEFRGQPLASIQTAFRKAAGRACLKSVSPTVLRHTGATLLAANGVPMRQISGMLGHTDVRTTERYAKHHPDCLQSAITTLEDVFG